MALSIYAIPDYFGEKIDMLVDHEKYHTCTMYTPLLGQCQSIKTDDTFELIQHLLQANIGFVKDFERDSM